MQARTWGNEYRTTTVCIDSYDNRVLVGRFYNAYSEEGVSFHGVMDFLTKIDDMLNRMNFPQAFTSMRSFSNIPVTVAEKRHDGMVPTGKKATFYLRILFRQNTSWQGNLVWLDGEREESFRSVLELLFLMDSAAAAEGGL